MNLYYLGILTIFSYLCTALLQGLHLFGFFHLKGHYRLGALCSLTTHGWLLYRLIELPNGQNLNWLVMLSFTLWLMNIFIFITSIRAKIESLNVLTAPSAALSVGLVMAFAGTDVLITKSQPGVLLHIFISFIAMSLLILASAQAVLMGVQNYCLKHHCSLLLLHILPPLQTMETLLFNIVLGGTVLFSASLLSGFFFPHHGWNTFLLPKTLLAISAWLLFGLLLIGRKRFGWRGPTAIRWTLSATLLALLSYFGTKALLL